MTTSTLHDVIIVGGGAAGSSTAMVLGRARADVALLDAGDPSNAPSTGIGGLLGNDGTTPAAFYARAAEELRAYPSISRHRAEVTSIDPGEQRRWRVSAHDDTGADVAYEADHVVLAVGMRYDRPDLDGLEGKWGASVFHCPFCHGWEHRDQPMAILGGDPHAPMAARLLRRWSDDVTFIDNDVDLAPEDRAALDELGVTVVAGTIAALEGHGRELAGIRLTDGRGIDAHAMLLPAPHTQRRPELLDGLGLDVDDTGHVVAGEMGHTNVAGLWAVGDLTSQMASVARVIAAGSLCASGITFELVAAGAEPARLG